MNKRLACACIAVAISVTSPGMAMTCQGGTAIDQTSNSRPQSGRILQAMAELWWARKRLPMRVAPDGVFVRSLSVTELEAVFMRSGCVVAKLTVPRELLRRFLLSRVGPEA